MTWLWYTLTSFCILICVFLEDTFLSSDLQEISCYVWVDHRFTDKTFSTLFIKFFIIINCYVRTTENLFLVQPLIFVCLFVFVYLSTVHSAHIHSTHRLLRCCQKEISTNKATLPSLIITVIHIDYSFILEFHYIRQHLFTIQ